MQWSLVYVPELALFLGAEKKKKEKKGQTLKYPYSKFRGKLGLKAHTLIHVVLHSVKVFDKKTITYVIVVMHTDMHTLYKLYWKLFVMFL